MSFGIILSWAVDFVCYDTKNRKTQMNIEVESLLTVFEDTKVIFKHPPRPLDLSKFDVETPVYCQPDVIQAMKKAWSQSANGTSGVEAGFRLDGTPRSYKIIPNAFTNQQKMQSLKIIPGLTFAIFHVHPNNSTRFPSTPKNNSQSNKDGDTGIADRFKMQIYVMHKDGMTMYDPITKEVTELRKNLDWLKPCI